MGKHEEEFVTIHIDGKPRQITRAAYLRTRRWEKRRAFRRALHVPFEWLGIGLGWLIFTNLPHRVLIGLCDWLSAILYTFDKRGRNRSLQNLRLVRGARPLDRTFDPDKAHYNPTRTERLIIRRAYRNMARTIGHIFWTCRAAKKRAAAVGEMAPRGKEFLAANKPAVTVSAHLGCWEILSQLAYLEGHSMLSVAKRIGTGGMTKMLMWARKSIGQEIVPADGAFRSLLAGIKSGKSLGLLVDQAVNPRDGGIWIRFFGEPLPVSAAPAFFAAKANAPIVVAWSRPVGHGHYRCEILDVIPAAAARDIWGVTQRCATDLEHIIRRHPSCWVLNYNFFRHDPTPDDLKTLEAREAKAKSAAAEGGNTP